MIRVLLVEDHTAFRQALALTFDLEVGIRVVGQAGNLKEARGQLQAEHVDVVILDLDLPDGNGADLIREFYDRNPNAVVLVLTGSGDPQDIARAVDYGASHVLHKTVPIAEIIDSVRRLHDSEVLLSRSDIQAILRVAHAQRADIRHARETLERLTRREREVLEALAHGLSDKEIALTLHVSKETVHTHMVNLLGKLGVDSRLQALIFAVKHGVVTLT